MLRVWIKFEMKNIEMEWRCVILRQLVQFIIIKNIAREPNSTQLYALACKHVKNVNNTEN